MDKVKAAAQDMGKMSMVMALIEVGAATEEYLILKGMEDAADLKEMSIVTAVPDKNIRKADAAVISKDVFGIIWHGKEYYCAFFWEFIDDRF